MTRNNHRLFRRLMCMLLTFAFALAPAMEVSAADGRYITFSGHMAGTKGNIAYFAVGIDGGGPLYRYNASTGKKTRIAKGKWSCINVKGNKLYLAKNNHGGSDGVNYYIYSMKTNGKSRKKLANGYNPVVRGKYIYYIATKKQTWYGEKVDVSNKGIYRMRLNGKGKKCLVKAVGYGNFEDLGVTSSGLVYKKNGQWYTCNFNGKGRKDLNTYYYACNMNVMWEGDYFPSYIDVNNGNVAYFGTGNIVRTYQFKNGKHVNHDLAKVKGEVHRIILSGNHMMVISDTYKNNSSDKYYVYMMRRNGKSKHKVLSGDNVSGGW